MKDLRSANAMGQYGISLGLGNRTEQYGGEGLRRPSFTDNGGLWEPFPLGKPIINNHYFFPLFFSFPSFIRLYIKKNVVA